MSSRDLYEAALIELNKLEAPSLLLEDYNYFMNKAVQQYINLVYAKFEVDQQATDDLRVLKSTTALTLHKLNEGHDLWSTTYYVDLPEDYIHLLGCVVEYSVLKNFKCYDAGDTMQFAARRLTTEMYSQILNNAYLRPMYKRPYYYINNINTSIEGKMPTHPQLDSEVFNYTHGYESEELSNINTMDDENKISNRFANPSTVRLEIRFGKDDHSVFVPSKVYIDYLKAPMYIRLTQNQINSVVDTSDVLEFPDYVCFEIVNIFTRLVMENSSDPRLQTNMPINQTILNPAAVAQAKQQQN